MRNELDRLLSTTGDIALRRRARWLIEHLDLKNGLKILDVGCGDGYYLYLLSNLKMKLNLAGIDSDKKALKSAKKNLNNDNVQLIFSMAEKLPFKSNSFDRVIASEVLEHITNDVVAGREINRILKPGGLFVASVPHASYPFLWDPLNWTLEKVFKTYIKSGFFAGIWNQHLRLYTKEKLALTLRKSGFKKIRMNVLTRWSLPFNHYLVNLVARFLANNKSSKTTNALNKFKSVNRASKFKLNPLWLIFQYDKLNDIYSSDKATGVSLVVLSKK